MLKITIPVSVYGSQSWLTKATIEGAPEAFRSTVVTCRKGSERREICEAGGQDRILRNCSEQRPYWRISGGSWNISLDLTLAPLSSYLSQMLMAIRIRLKLFLISFLSKPLREQYLENESRPWENNNTEDVSTKTEHSEYDHQNGEEDRELLVALVLRGGLEEGGVVAAVLVPGKEGEGEALRSKEVRSWWLITDSHCPAPSASWSPADRSSGWGRCSPSGTSSPTSSLGLEVSQEGPRHQLCDPGVNNLSYLEIFWK